MNRQILILMAALAVGAIAAVLWPAAQPPPAGTSPGGATTVAFGPRPTFLAPAENLPVQMRPMFRAGQALVEQPWVRAPSSTDARDGLGPLYNARRCTGCHIQGGRGLAPDVDGPLSTATLVRLASRDGACEATYGSQLQPRSIDAAYALGGADVQLPAEGTPVVQWVQSRVTYPDGQEAELRRPQISFTHMAYGVLPRGVQVGLRHAPPLYGLGLIDAIPQAEIAAGADPHDADRDGISGRPNWVDDAVTGVRRLGRFGLKANQPSLRQQVAGALSNDMGLTSSLFPHDTCTETQTACKAAPSGAGPEGVEVPDSVLKMIVDFNRDLAVPGRRKPGHSMVLAGQAHFETLGCARCHRPRWRTGDDKTPPHLSSQVIFPYSDLLLHDMGPDLADGRPDGEASGREWRTPPLWGVGLARAVHRDVGLLHDGRARTVEEAVLWHGGEAASSRSAFVALTQSERGQLLAFVRSL